MSLSPQRVDFEKVWATLSVNTGKILILAEVKGMPMVEDVYKLCIAQPQSHSETLYFRLKKFLEDHVDSIRENILAAQSDILGLYLSSWQKYNDGAEYCDRIYRYLNTNWIMKRQKDSQNKLGSIYQSSSAVDIHDILTLTIIVWRERVYIPMKDKLWRAAAELLLRIRDGEDVTPTLFSGLSLCLLKLGGINKNKPLDLYKDEIETQYLTVTRDYYARESSSFIAANGISAYMKKAEGRLEEEKKRSVKILDGSSIEKARKECVMTLVAHHLPLLHVECEVYLRDNKQDDLARMYRLLSFLDDGISHMLDVLQKFIVNVGFEAVKAIPEKDRQEAKPYVDALLQVYHQFSSLVRTAFDSSPAFTACLDKACRQMVNENIVNSKNPSKSAELLAKYCDILLKKGNKNLEDNALDDHLNQIIILFKYVDDKDVFQKFYSKMLARRLIHELSISDDAERVMIGGLKQACGFEYTNKLQRMFTDIQISSEMKDKFKEHLSNEGLSLGKLEYSILVLTAGSWPLQVQSSSFNVPEELEKCVDLFQNYYNAQHQGRKLAWLHHLSKGELKSTYLKKPFEFQVANYQMGVLLAYNNTGGGGEGGGMTIEDLRRVTNIKDTELTRTVDSLVDAFILKRKSPPSSSDVTMDPQSEEYILNLQYSSKRLKVKVAGGLQKETKAQNEETYRGIDDDRKLYLQAAIVRIMKARKSLTHTLLIQEVIEQSKARFTPLVPMIKKCIEQLIEKEYIARVEGESDKYAYLA